MPHPPRLLIVDMHERMRRIVGRVRRRDQTEDDMAELETFLAIALRVFEKTNPSKLAEMARIVEIQFYMRRLPKTEERNKNETSSNHPR